MEDSHKFKNRTQILKNEFKIKPRLKETELSSRQGKNILHAEHYRGNCPSRGGLSIDSGFLVHVLVLGQHRISKNYFDRWPQASPIQGAKENLALPKRLAYTFPCPVFFLSSLYGLRLDFLALEAFSSKIFAWISIHAKISEENEKVYLVGLWHHIWSLNFFYFDPTSAVLDNIYTKSDHKAHVRNEKARKKCNDRRVGWSGQS